MDVKISGGDTTLDISGKEEYVEGIEEIFQRVILCISTRKGEFIYDKDYGVRELPKITDERSLKNAEAYLGEAIADIDGAHISLKKLRQTSSGTVIKITVTYLDESIWKEVTVK